MELQVQSDQANSWQSWVLLVFPILISIFYDIGSGKTTFLDILARKRKGGTVGGDVLINDCACPDDFLFRRISGYVDQEDIHLPMLTVREVLEFSAFTRLPESVSSAEKLARVETVMKQLGLSHVANSRVGDSLKRGLSGGEKKRLSIATELVTNPSILFVDEPTSGLDSFNAYQVVQTLANLASEHKKTVRFLAVAIFISRLFLLSINLILLYLIYSIMFYY